jgi:hypothetical protein
VGDVSIEGNRAESRAIGLKQSAERIASSTTYSTCSSADAALSVSLIAENVKVHQRSPESLSDAYSGNLAT